jgi:hypothetical protein
VAILGRPHGKPGPAFGLEIQPGVEPPWSVFHEVAREIAVREFQRPERRDVVRRQGRGGAKAADEDEHGQSARATAMVQRKAQNDAPLELKSWTGHREQRR